MSGAGGIRPTGPPRGQAPLGTRRTNFSAGEPHGLPRPRLLDEAPFSADRAARGVHVLPAACESRSMPRLLPAPVVGNDRRSRPDQSQAPPSPITPRAPNETDGKLGNLNPAAPRSGARRQPNPMASWEGTSPLAVPPFLARNEPNGKLDKGGATMTSIRGVFSAGFGDDADAERTQWQAGGDAAADRPPGRGAERTQWQAGQGANPAGEPPAPRRGLEMSSGGVALVGEIGLRIPGGRGASGKLRSRERHPSSDGPGARTPRR